ncbi:MAG: sulfite exporter TauE/SafE family protein [Alphaproteobacteria bacterium]|nr:sulfite exporter TauE/SafE family protein [Alphaproteobacteria bacterium]
MSQLTTLLPVLISGLTTGVIHVFSGPDHLAAVAPLAVEKRHAGGRIGLTWGFGHSTGVVAVALVALLVRELLPVESLSNWSERLVGVVLIAVGFWAVRKASKIEVHAHAHAHDGGEHVHIHAHVDEKAHEYHVGEHVHAAMAIGVLHGFAGSAHFLGVLPALALPSRVAAVSYVLAFAVGTVFAMGTFGAMIAAVVTRTTIPGSRFYQGVLATMGVFSVAVGVYWL